MSARDRWIGFIAFILGALTVILVMVVRGHRDAETAAATRQTQPAEGRKKLWTCGMHPQVVQDHPGNCPICHMKLAPMRDDSASGPATTQSARKILYWWDPMLGPSSISDKPGKSAMGMDMVPVYADQASAGPMVRIDPTIVQNMGVRTAQVMRGPLELSIRAVGMLKVPEPGLHDVTLKMGGWIDKLYADTEGMVVKKGEPLFDLYSPDLQIAEEELMMAARSLRSPGADAGEPVKVEAQKLLESSRRKLRLWDVAEQDIDAIAAAERAPRTITFRSPSDGHVLDKMIVQGSAVQSGMKLMRIEDHSKLWLDAEIYEQQIPMVAIGQSIDAIVEGVPGKTFTGKIAFVYPHVDHMTRTETVRTTLENPKHELRPGMYATATIIARPIDQAVLVPREAVIDTGTRQIAFVAESEGHFQPRNVRVGLRGGDVVQILEGLAPGEAVVTSGQFLMDVESRTTEAIQKLRGGAIESQQPPSTPNSQN